MLPIVGVPETIALGMSAYRKVFCRATGFEHVSRYISGLLVSENKTLQGIATQQIYPKGKTVSRRAKQGGIVKH